MEKEETEAKALFVTVCIKLDQTTFFTADKNKESTVLVLSWQLQLL
jgi:hypothetical protein